MDDQTIIRRTAYSRAFVAFCWVLLALSWGAALTTRGLDHWSAGPLVVITLFTVASEWMAVRLDEDSLTFVSGSFLGIVLCAVLYGGGPAVALGVFTIVTSWPRTREMPSVLVSNLATFSVFPLAAGLCFHALVSATHAGTRSSVYYLCVFGAFATALTLNLAMIVLPRATGVRGRLLTMRSYVEPVLAAELFSAALTVAAVWVTLHLHLAGLIMFGIVLAIFQYLVGELITSHRRSARLRRVATTDELTGLANRERFLIQVARRIGAGTPFAVLLVDLDRFKEINDTLGHDYGDRLLQDLGPRLKGAIGEGGFVARLGGDEFAVVLAEGVTDSIDLEAAVARLLDTVSKPFAVDELSLEVGASVGVARCPEDGGDAHALLRCADIAMYAAKHAATDYKLYRPEQNAHTVERLNVLSDIRRALSANEIVVHYQPIVDLESGVVQGAEGLVRWEHPERGLIPPGAFVPTVEQTGLIGPLTRHVLAAAIAECAGWRRTGRELSVAVNLSVRNLQDRDLAREIERLLDAHHLPADALRLEITESMIMSDPERAMITVSRLSALGVRLSVDDFGTGYSSLANLRRLPIDELKIDRSFVSPMLRDESDLIIVRSTINLGHDLGLKIIAEGVEDENTLDHLARLGCDLAQGYHLSRPLSAGAFARWLADPPWIGSAQKSVV